MTRNLRIAKEVIKNYIEDARFGIFNTRNIAGDPMEVIYCEDGLTIEICYYYGYFEVFGLSEEFKELKNYYVSLLYETEK